MSHIPATEYANLEAAVERIARGMVGRYRLSESDLDELVSVGLAAAGAAWSRWAWDGDVPLSAFVSAQAKWPMWHECQRIMEERGRCGEEDVDDLSVDSEDDANPMLARLDALASLHRCVAIALALEAGEKPAAVASLYPSENGRAMAYVVLRREEREGRWKIATDPELQRLSGRTWEPGPISLWDAAVLGREVAKPAQLSFRLCGLAAQEDRHVLTPVSAQPPMRPVDVVSDVAVLVRRWAVACSVAAMAVVLARMRVVRVAPARAAPW